jgi:hypothetical protein
MSPPLRGFTFSANWNGQSLASLAERVRLMPPTAPNSLSATEIANLLAYLLRASGFPAGDAELGNAVPYDSVLYTSARRAE